MNATTKTIMGAFTSEDVLTIPGPKRTATIRILVTATSHWVQIQAGKMKWSVESDSTMALRKAKRCSENLWMLVACKDCDLNDRVESIFRV